MAEPTKYPYPESIERLARYDRYRRFLEGDHFNAFSMEVGQGLSKKYARLRYITANFAGLISKIIADMLFGEEIQFKFEDSKKNDFANALYFNSKMKTQNYESALYNSAVGDAVFKVRVKEGEIFVDDINPAIYNPELTGNFRETPETEDLAWTNIVGKKKYLVREIHTPGLVETKVYVFKGEIKKNGQDDLTEIENEVDLGIYNQLAGTEYEATIETNIDKNLIVHIPNYRLTKTYWGTSDYIDLESLMFALNNRMTHIDNVLDKHSDPILAVPEGVLDENGNVAKSSLGMVELPEDGGNKPEYIVWNANLDAAFRDVDTIVEFLHMFSETSADATSNVKDGAKAESGRALKMRLLRTIAKRNRKRLYYDQGLQEVLMIAQELSKSNGFTAGGLKVDGEPEIAQIMWSDGLVNDEIEITQNEALKKESKLTSQKRAIMNSEGVNEDEAQKIIDEIDDEKSEANPFFDSSPAVDQTQDVDDKNLL